MKFAVPFIVFLTFIFAWLFVLRSQIYTFNAQKNDIDLLQEALPGIFKLIPHKKELNFYSSCNDGQQYVQYFQSQFVMAPDIIIKFQPVQPGDTVLIVEKNCPTDTTKSQSFNEIVAINKDALKIKLCVKK